MLKSMLVNKHFHTWLLIGWQQAASQSEAMLENPCKLTCKLTRILLSNPGPWSWSYTYTGPVFVFDLYCACRMPCTWCHRHNNIITQRGRNDDHTFAQTISKCMFFNENYFFNKISIFPKVQLSVSIGTGSGFVPNNCLGICKIVLQNEGKYKKTYVNLLRMKDASAK